MTKKADIDELRWVRLFTPIHIPRSLVEQISKRDYDIDDLYRYLEVNCLRQTKEGPTLNPLFHVWALVHPDNIVKGFLWFTVDALTKDIVIQIYSVDSAYWGCKGAVLKLAEHLKNIREKAKLNKIYWITKAPKHSHKYGFKQSKNVLMEYMEEEKDGKDTDGGAQPRAKPRSSYTRTEELSK